MAFVRVLSKAQLPPDSTVEVKMEGFPLAICRVGDSIHALWGICPHQSAPLGYGSINGDNVTCPWHGWEFNCETGRNDYDPNCRVQTFPVKVEGDDILVDFHA